MHTVELYAMTKSLASEMGYQIREEDLGGVGAGACLVAGRKCVFVDISSNTAEQLEQLSEAIANDPLIHTMNVPDALRGILKIRRAA